MINFLFLLLPKSKNNVISDGGDHGIQLPADFILPAAIAEFLCVQACGSNTKSTECLLCTGVSKMVSLKIFASTCELVRKTFSYLC